MTAVVPLTGLDPATPDEDLEPLVGLIGDAAIVAIGESAHFTHEYYRLRDRLTRFLIERVGFTAVAMESGFPEGNGVDTWIRGGSGSVADVQATGITYSLGRCREMHDFLTWLRAHNRTASPPARFYGIDVPGSMGSLTPALDPLLRYLQRTDPSCAAGMARSRALAAGFEGGGGELMPVDSAREAYANLPVEQRDSLTAALAGLQLRMEAQRLSYIGRSGEEEYDLARRHLRSAIWGDSVLRQSTAPADGDPGPANLRDAAMADTVEWIMKRETRIVLLAHNAHIQRTPFSPPGLPATRDTTTLGQHLADRHGAGYLAIGTTCPEGTIATYPLSGSRPAARSELVAKDLPPAGTDLVDGLLATVRAGPYLLDVRHAAAAFLDTAPRMRVREYEVDLPVRAAFDLIAHIPRVSPWQASSPDLLPRREPD